MDKKVILQYIKEQNYVERTLHLVIGALLLAINYNLFFIPNNIVMGGTSGLAIIINKVFGIKEDLFLLSISVLLLIVSFLFLGAKETSDTIIGSILYPVFVSITAPLCAAILPLFKFDTILTTVLVSGLLYGLANGIIYKAGFTTGGVGRYYSNY